ncbi:MAG TPA: glycoside hydrolase family 15 protein [Pyrinomonadaceae bacterium]|jgi:glucoamylase
MTRIVLLILFGCQVVMAQSGDAHWATAAKNGFGTSNTLASKVWFTLADGVMTEVFYPTVDMPNVQMLKFQVVMGTKIEDEVDDTVHRLELPNPASLTFRQINRAKSGAYTITKTYITDPHRNTVLIEVDFQTQTNAQLNVYYDPSLNNSGMHDTGSTDVNALLASDGDIASALVPSCGFVNADTVTQNGNVLQSGTLKKNRCTIALAFGKTTTEALETARASLARGFETTRAEYETGWARYVSRLPRIARHQQQFNMAAMVLRALEDATTRGAVIASPSTPWGGGPNANEPNTTGYHSVWSRDLYHVATAFDAMGDRITANRLLNYLFRVQQKLDGSFPQNSFVDGRTVGDGLQMDQVALPLVLAYQLGRNDRTAWVSHIKAAADFIVRNGPRTDQDRWEEKSGYSPSSLAAQIAGLVCAAEIAKANLDDASAKRYLDTADNWVKNIEKWTVTKGDGASGYYLRITANNDPNDGAKMEINSSTRVVDERKILDAGFLELVRLGIKAPRDPLIVESLKLIDQLIKVKTPVGEAWYRYNHDAYGETPDGGKYDGRNGVGRLWTLLTGERGEYELAAGDIASARKRLDTLAGFANDGLMIPEQVWDREESPAPSLRFGAGTGSATPLAWSMAQFIRLAMSIERGRNVETPRVVWERYGSRG